MAETLKISLSLNWDLMEKFDEIIKREGFYNRSKAIRKLMEDHIISEKIRGNKYLGNVSGTFVIILLSKESVSIKDHICITISTKDFDFLSFIVLEGATYTEAESEFSSLKKEDAVTFCKLLQMEKAL